MRVGGGCGSDRVPVVVVCNREIAEDEFLPEVTKSKYVVCHFYHREFLRCKIMDKVRVDCRKALPSLGGAHVCSSTVLAL